MPKLGILESLLRYDVHGAGRVDDSPPRARRRALGPPKPIPAYD